MNFTDPLLKDKDGKPQYSLTDESGAILRVSWDFRDGKIGRVSFFPTWEEALEAVAPSG